MVRVTHRTVRATLNTLKDATGSARGWRGICLYDTLVRTVPPKMCSKEPFRTRLSALPPGMRWHQHSLKLVTMIAI